MTPTTFKVVIVHPPRYAHSVAFRELAEMLHHGLKALGHPSAITENGFDPAATNLVLAWHLLNPTIVEALPEHCIIYNLEQLDERRSPWSRPGSWSWKWSSAWASSASQM